MSYLVVMAILIKLMRVIIFGRFQSAPVSLHGLVSLCALACLTSDHTLMLATLQELDKLLGKFGHPQSQIIRCK